MDQMQYAVIQWITDKNKLSIEHLKCVTEPKKAWNDYEAGEKGKAKFGKEEFECLIRAVGPSRKSLMLDFKQALEERNALDTPENEADQELRDKENDKEGPDHGDGIVVKKRRASAYKGDKLENDGTKKKSKLTLKTSLVKQKVSEADEILKLRNMSASTSNTTHPPKMNMSLSPGSPTTPLPRSNSSSSSTTLPLPAEQNAMPIPVSTFAATSNTTHSELNLSLVHGSPTTPLPRSTTPSLNTTLPTEPNKILTPGRNEVLTPGRNEVLTPGQNEFLTPGQNEVLTPGRNEVLTPGRNEVLTPGRNEVLTPGRNEVLTPVSTSTPQPGFNTMVPPVSNTQFLPPGANSLQFTPTSNQTFTEQLNSCSQPPFAGYDYAPFYSHQGVNNISQGTRHNTFQQQDYTRCHSCCDIIEQLTQRVFALEQAEEARQKKKMNRDQKRTHTEATLSTVPFDLDEDRLKDLVEKSCSLSSGVDMLLNEVFSTEELINSSVMGIDSGKSLGKPGLDSQKRSTIEGILTQKFCVPVTAIRMKMRDRLKLIRRKHGDVEKN
ncbi:uncharacterized protein LOC132731403 isoform X2 [Ruditapes philippinarum]|uniref:uncharacterized protein LOC132731403 isoform X2 n=1 Tax=Ruditapes philippinarum TaxID=129788 RepID=UPI00295A590E|nr:uncharacterized protein LOC132731403 isoform X2 [Ruditapes philippinarum]